MAIKYKWLAGRLRERIINDIERGINRLPTEQELCSKYHVSRQTVRQALSVLENEGLIEKRKGSGSYITGLSSDSAANVIHILVSSDSEYIYPFILNDIQNTLMKSGFRNRVHVTDNHICTEREILSGFLAHPPRGIIAEGCKSALPNPNLDLYHRLKRSGCKLVFLHNYYPALHDSFYVKDDNIAGSVRLVHYLAQQGHTAIGGIFKADDLQGMERYQGYMEAMYDLNLTVPEDHISWFNSEDLAGLIRSQDTYFLKKTVQKSLDSCTAVICYNDMIAYFLIKELKLSGYHLPDDMSIASFDNSYLSNFDTLPLTTLSHKPHEAGEAAARMMIDRLKGLPVAPKELSWSLIPRESTPDPSRRF